MTPKGLALLLTLALHSSLAQSEISFEWVTVGDPGNPNDPLTGVPSDVQTPVRGAVPYVYSISKYETTIGQYTSFLNAVAKSNPQGNLPLYDGGLGHWDSIRGIARISVDGKAVYYVKNVSQVSIVSQPTGGTSAYLPITYTDYLDAVRFANWLHNGQGDGDTETGAYTISNGQITRASRSGGVVTVTTAEPHSLNVGDWVQLFSNSSFYDRSAIVTARTDTTFSYFSGVEGDSPEQELPASMIGVSARKSDARYWVPSENEWYKAAYYDPSPDGPADDYWGFPWRSDSTGGGFGNYFVVRYSATNRPEFEFQYYTYLMDVHFGAPSYYGAVSLAGNVEEWTEGDAFSGGPHTRGGWWQRSFTQGVPQVYAYQRSVSFYLRPSGVAPPEEPSDQGRGFRIATVANPPAGGLRNGDKIRFHPRVGHNRRMIGGVFEANTDGFDSYTVLHTITETPPDGWTEVNVDFGKARNFRYRSPDGGHGNVAEIEFYRSGAKLIAAASGTLGSWNNLGSTFDKALDGNVDTFFDTQEPNGAYLELDSGTGTPSGTPQGHDRLTVTGTNANGSGDYPSGQRVRLYISILPEGQSFAGWEGFTSILDDPSSPETYATIPGIGVDLRLNATFKPQPPGTHRLDVEGGWGDGTYPAGTMVTVNADLPPVGQQFSRWTGDIAILSNPFLATTTALIPSMNVSIAATYRAANSSDTIRFYPRLFHTARMVGGVFEGTNGDPISGPYENIYTISSEPPLAWNEIHLNLKYYRYLRYRGPNNSYGNVAEIEFFRAGEKLTGAAFGTPGSWYDLGNTLDKAFDGNIDTFFDAPIANEAYVGIDISNGPISADKIRFYPRLFHTARMVGGVFEGTNADPIDGPYETIYTISGEPPLAWNQISVDLKNYRYLRYRGPTGSFGNVAEIEFYRDGAKLIGQSFGTPGSWYDLGNTFDKALDGNLETFFDAPIATGAFVGIDSP